jgi:hypothetical protein
MYTAVDKYYVYLVQKRTAGFTGTVDGSNNPTSYMRFGYIRMKHHIVGGYKMYLLQQPSTTIYTFGFDFNWIRSYRANNVFNQWSLNNIDTQVKMSGQGSWQFLSINAGNSMNAALNDQFDPS